MQLAFSSFRQPRPAGEEASRGWNREVRAGNSDCQGYGSAVVIRRGLPLRPNRRGGCFPLSRPTSSPDAGRFSSEPDRPSEAYFLIPGRQRPQPAGPNSFPPAPAPRRGFFVSNSPTSALQRPQLPVMARPLLHPVGKVTVMEFRWLIFLTLWTLLSGPVLARPVLAHSPVSATPATNAQR
jgi:hypothetical protein